MPWMAHLFRQSNRTQKASAKPLTVSPFKWSCATNKTDVRHIVYRYTKR